MHVHESGAGYYIFPDFSIAREGLLKRGITTGEQMCDAMLQEADVAVRIHLTIYNLIIVCFGGPHDTLLKVLR